MDLVPLERAIGHIFLDKSLLVQALTTEAYSNEARQHGEPCKDQDVLATLGDAMLKAVLVDHLITAGFGSSGEITVRKIELEQEATLAAIARRLGVGERLRLGKGQIKHNHQDHPNLLAETLEAIVAAIYLDVGFRATRRIIIRWFEDYLIQA